MRILNLTGNTVTIVGEDDRMIVSYPPDGFAQCEVTKSVIDRVGGVQIKAKHYSKVEGLPSPDPSNSKYYIVNNDVAEAVKHGRFDLLTIDEMVDRVAANTLYCRSLVNFV